MKKIAIKGHPTRGEDVIKILESLGGINKLNLKGYKCTGYYYIENNCRINCTFLSCLLQEYTCYTLEEYEQTFLKTMEKIAIQGHSTRSNDIIKILESLGGINRQIYIGNDSRFYYYVNNASYIDCDLTENLPRGYKKYTLEEYEQKFLNTMENKRTIQIDLTTAKEWYQQGGDLRKVALQAFSEKELNSLPSSWEEYCEINPRLDANKEIFLLTDGHINPLSNTAYYARKEFPGALPSKERAEQFVVLNKLLQIRDYYNQGWKPNWDDGTKKYVIWAARNELYMEISTHINALFAFKSKEVRDEFVYNFKEDLKKIKEFL